MAQFSSELPNSVFHLRRASSLMPSMLSFAIGELDAEPAELLEGAEDLAGGVVGDGLNQKISNEERGKISCLRWDDLN